MSLTEYIHPGWADGWHRLCRLLGWRSAYERALDDAAHGAWLAAHPVIPPPAPRGGMLNYSKIVGPPEVHDPLEWGDVTAYAARHEWRHDLETGTWWRTTDHGIEKMTEEGFFELMHRTFPPRA